MRKSFTWVGLITLLAVSQVFAISDIFLFKTFGVAMCVGLANGLGFFEGYLYD